MLVAPHHGSEERTTQEFVKAVHPRAIISSNDNTLSIKQRSFDADVKGAPIYRTSRYGAVTVEVTKNGRMSVSSYRDGKLLEFGG